MKVTPVATPHAMAPTPTSNQTAGRERAIAKLNSLNAPQVEAPVAKMDHVNHVANPNAISVEELSAVKPNATQMQSDAIVDSSTESVEATEKSVPAPVEEKPQQDPALSRQFAQLARQERALRAKVQQQQQAIKAKEAELAAKEAAIATKEQQYSQGYISKDQLKADTLRILADNGVSYDELTQQILNQAPSNPRMDSHIARLEAKIAELEKANEQSKQSYTEQQQQQYQAAVKQIKMDAASLVKNDPNFETIKATGSVDDVVELITATYEKDGVLLSVEEAAKEVEDYLVDEAMKVTRIGKIKRRLEESARPAAQTSLQKTAQSTQKTQPAMKTLTNTVASTRQLSARDRAVLAFKGELKG